MNFMEMGGSSEYGTVLVDMAAVGVVNMPGKYLCNDYQHMVADMLEGIKAVYPGLFIAVDQGIALLNRDRGDRVAILAGCGAGHEPYPVGFVGENLLTGCVIGHLFEAPPVPQIVNAILNLSKWNTGGIILVGLNYTSIALNFWIAARKAMEAGIKIKVIILSDDCALERNSLKEGHVSMTLKRGLCGALICAKIMGGMSGAGFSLEEIHHHGTVAHLRTATISACYGCGRLPKSYRPLVKLTKYEVLIGVGAHGEEGLKRVKMAPLKIIVEAMIKQIFEVFLIAQGDKVLLFINDCGVCTEMESYILAREVQLQLAPKVLVVKAFVGRFFTSLDMKGFQICLTNISTNELWLKYMEKGTEAFAWPSNKFTELVEERPERETSFVNLEKFLKPDRWKLSYDQAHIFGQCIQATCNALKKREAELNKMDAVCTMYRSGDFGTKIRMFADRILKDVKGAPLLMDQSKTFLLMSQIAEDEIDSPFGPVLAVLFIGAAKGHYSWESVWHEALETLYTYSTARLGHRTLLDAFIPAHKAFKTTLAECGDNCWKKALKAALLAAENGCKDTIHMRPKTWIELQGTLTFSIETGVSDPGAEVVVTWLKALNAQASKKRKSFGGSKTIKKTTNLIQIHK